jgi:TolB-like protein/Flp pilus assembly protein TadD
VDPVTARAVFLSYASQDAEAAKRICDALRAQGVEVWFDQNELVGGDAWDTKIRKQIGECALFIPLISAHAQARREGYFRLEWRLAAQRTHMMSEQVAFLLPVVIDDTRDAVADVPAEFKAVQWTRLSAGEASSAFCARVVRLLRDGSEPAAPAPAREPVPVRSAPESAVPPSRKLPVLAIAAGVVVAGIVAGYWFLRPSSRATTVAEKPAAATSARSPLAEEVERLRARIVPDRWQKGDFEAIDPTLERITREDPNYADAWALRSLIHSLQTMRLIDRGTKPLQAGRQMAERALSLAPDSPWAQLALGYHLTANINRGGDPEAGRVPMERALAALPVSAITRYGALSYSWNAYDLPATEARAKEWLEAEPNASFPAWIMASMSNVLRRPDAALRWTERVVSDPNITGIRAHSTIFDAHFYLRADLSAAATAIEQVPARGRSVPRIIFCRWLVNSALGRHDDALQILATLPEPLLSDIAYSGPKALLAALSHTWAGRSQAAAVQFREAERLLRERLAGDPESEEFRIALALTLAGLGRAEEARTELALVEPALRGRAPSLYRGQLFSMTAQAYAQMGDATATCYYLRRIFTELSIPMFTPASLRQDPRFSGIVGAPDVKALFAEFAHLDPVATVAPEEKSVAVLPFANLSGDPTQEYFSDGLTEEILNALARERDLRVPGRASSFSFKGKNVPAAEMAKALNVSRLVEGSVRRSGNKVRISVTLTRASDGFSEELGTFTEELTDIFALQDKVASAVVAKLTNRTGSAAVGARRAVNPEAYGLYLQARAAWAQRTREGYRQTEQFLLRALEIEPGNVQAMALLSMNYSSMSRSAEPELLTKANLWAERALAADPNLADALAAKALTLSDVGDFDGAIKLLRRSIEIDPGFATGHQWLGRQLAAAGDLDGAVGALRTAAQLDPLAPRILDNYASTLAYAGRVEEALKIIDGVLAAQPTWQQGIQFRARFLFQLGRLDEALTLYVGQGVAQRDPAWAVRALLAAGRRAEAEQLVAARETGFSKGLALCALGRPREALAMLQPRTSFQREFLLWEQADVVPRDLPEFHAALKEWGLADAWARAEAWRARNKPPKH